MGGIGEVRWRKRVIRYAGGAAEGLTSSTLNLGGMDLDSGVLEGADAAASMTSSALKPARCPKIHLREVRGNVKSFTDPEVLGCSKHHAFRENSYRTGVLYVKHLGRRQESSSLSNPSSHHKPRRFDVALQFAASTIST